MQLIWIYPTLILIGGLIGHFKANSIPSLIAGIVCSGLLYFGAYLWTSKHELRGYTLSVAMTVFLFAFFSYRFSLAFAWMPAGMMVIASALQLFLLISLNKKLNKKTI